MLEHDNNFVHCTYENQVLYITFKNTLPTDEDWKWAKTTVLSYYTANTQQKTRFSIVCDMLHMPTLPLHRTKDWIAFFNDNKVHTKNTLLCLAYITSNPFVQASMNMFFRMYKAERPVLFAKTLADAKQFIIDNQKHPPC